MGEHIRIRGAAAAAQGVFEDKEAPAGLSFFWHSARAGVAWLSSSPDRACRM